MSKKIYNYRNKIKKLFCKKGLPLLGKPPFYRLRFFAVLQISYNETIRSTPIRKNFIYFSFILPAPLVLIQQIPKSVYIPVPVQSPLHMQNTLPFTYSPSTV